MATDIQNRPQFVIFMRNNSQFIHLKSSSIVYLWSKLNWLKSCYQPSRIPKYLTCFLIMGLCGLVSCNANKFTFGSNVTPIRQLQQRTDNQRKVYVQGKVEKHAPLIKKWVYQINDSTSKIWVVTDESNYKEGQEIVFKAKVHYKSIPLAGQEFGEVYLEEE